MSQRPQAPVCESEGARAPHTVGGLGAGRGGLSTSAVRCVGEAVAVPHTQIDLWSAGYPRSTSALTTEKVGCCKSQDHVGGEKLGQEAAFPFLEYLGPMCFDPELLPGTNIDS